MGVTNHHRAGEVLVEVIHIFTHSKNKMEEKKKISINGADGDSSSNDRLVPVSEASRHADVVEQNQMLHELAEADAPSMRTNRN